MLKLINAAYKISLYKNLYSVDKPEFDIDINELYETIKFGYLKNEIEAIRKTNNNKERYNNLKRSTIPTVTLSGLFGYRNTAGLLKHSGLIQIDIDKIEYFDKVFSEICKDAYTYVAFKSPGGKGIKVIVKINPSAETHLGQFFALETYYKASFDIDIDSACKDLARTMLLSYDPNIYCNPHSSIFEIIEEKTNNKLVKSKPGSPACKVVNYPKEDLEIVEYIADAVATNKVDITATHEKWIKVGFSIANTLGVIGRAYFQKISSIYPGYNFEECDKVYTGLLDANNGSISVGTLIYYAKEAGVCMKHHSCNFEITDEPYSKLKN